MFTGKQKRLYAPHSRRSGRAARGHRRAMFAWALTARLQRPAPPPREARPAASARGIIFFLYDSGNHLNVFGSERLPRSVESQASGSVRLEAEGRLVCPTRWPRTPSPGPGTASGLARDPGLEEGGPRSVYPPRPGVWPLPQGGWAT